MNTVILPPNVPVVLKLSDPQGDSATQYDFELRIGRYSTTDGRILALPRQAVIQLNALDPLPGEELRICRQWSGKSGDPFECVIELTARAEQARAVAETGLQSVAEILGEDSAQELPQADLKPPAPIRKPVKAASPIQQPRLFDRGTGTDGPAPLALPLKAVASSRMPPMVRIPANVAVREILAFIKADPSTANWGDQAVQDLASTVIISAYKAGHVGLWEREA